MDMLPKNLKKHLTPIAPSLYAWLHRSSLRGPGLWLRDWGHSYCEKKIDPLPPPPVVCQSRGERMKAPLIFGSIVCGLLIFLVGSAYILYTIASTSVYEPTTPMLIDIRPRDFPNSI